MLAPFFPLSPHLPVRNPSPSWDMLSDDSTLAWFAFLSVGVWRVAPPSIAATEECAQRACLRIADVTVMHSVMTKAIGSIATAIGRPACGPEAPFSIVPLSIVIEGVGVRQTLGEDRIEVASIHEPSRRMGNL